MKDALAAAVNCEDAAHVQTETRRGPGAAAEEHDRKIDLGEQTKILALKRHDDAATEVKHELAFRREVRQAASHLAVELRLGVALEIRAHAARHEFAGAKGAAVVDAEVANESQTAHRHRAEVLG